MLEARFRPFTSNSKTGGLSLDFPRDYTCQKPLCEYCYVDKYERGGYAGEGYYKNVVNNYKLLIADPEKLATLANNTIRKLKTSKAEAYVNGFQKMGVIRIFGGGDYIPAHLEMFKKLEFDFYIISKKLVLLINELDAVTKLQHTRRILLSFDKNNIDAYHDIVEFVNNLSESHKVRYAFTGRPHELSDLLKDGFVFNRFFNIRRTKKEKEESRKFKDIACPVDSGLMKIQNACAKCKKCFK